MLIDCTTCVARDLACGDCVISVLLNSPPASAPGHRHRSRVGNDAVALDDDAFAALGHLADAGLVPPLRLVEPMSARSRGEDGDSATRADRGIA